MTRKSPKDMITIRRLKVGDRATLPGTVARFIGEGARRSVVFNVPGGSTGRLTIRAEMLPGAADLEEGDMFPLGCSVTRLDDRRAVVTVDGFPLARHEVDAAALAPPGD